jgi:hypothetical protein
MIYSIGLRTYSWPGIFPTADRVGVQPCDSGRSYARLMAAEGLPEGTLPSTRPQPLGLSIFLGRHLRKDCKTSRRDPPTRPDRPAPARSRPQDRYAFFTNS